QHPLHHLALEALAVGLHLEEILFAPQRWIVRRRSGARRCDNYPDTGGSWPFASPVPPSTWTRRWSRGRSMTSTASLRRSTSWRTGDRRARGARATAHRVPAPRLRQARSARHARAHARARHARAPFATAARAP